MYPFPEEVIPDKAYTQENDEHPGCLEIEEDRNCCKENTSYQEMFVYHRKDDHYCQEEKPEVKLCKNQRFFFVKGEYLPQSFHVVSLM